MFSLGERRLKEYVKVRVRVSSAFKVTVVVFVFRV
jgi:hypothetical protein